ncbi:MAG: DUF1302 family protein [Pseudomonadota bacterium]
MKTTVTRAMGRVMGGACLLVSAGGHAADWQFSGLVREDAAWRVGGETNSANQQGIRYNGVAAPNTGLGPYLAPGVSPATLTRPAALAHDNRWNVLQSRLELNADGKLDENWDAHVKVRGIMDQLPYADSAFKGIDLYRQPMRGSGAGTALEISGRRSMLDLPAAYLDYHDGPWWVRVGNQQIAWGEAIFFRVLDIPNGIDFRRHAILDVAAEEYSDKRVSSPGLRASFRADDGWEVEGYAQLFQPSILPTPDSPYNIVQSQFTIDQREGYQAAKHSWSFGTRLRGKIGDVGFQLVAARRRNPDGVFRWTDSKAGMLAGTPFEAGTGRGVYSAAEWFNSAGNARLNAVTGLAAALNEFPATLGLGSAAVAAGCGASVSASKQIAFPNAGAASCMLDTFFDPAVGLGNLVGHLTREYPRENVFGASANYIVKADADSFLNELVTRFELSYTPDKRFTNPSLSRQYLTRNETQFAAIVEKYHKFSEALPATYMVAQWLHKSASDLFGRSLAGQGAPEDVLGVPKGAKHYNAVALAFQQPSPTLEWRTDLTVLTDFRGGWLVQPGVKWHPNKEVQVDLYANVIRSNGRNDDFAGNLKSAREVFMRATYFF